MTMMRAVLALIFALVALPAAAQEETIVAGLSQSNVSITTDFVGSEILIYGAVKRESPMPEGPLDVIVTVEGPPVQMVVRRKERVWGIWVNNAQVTVDQAPSFYAVASTAPLDLVLSDTDDLRHKISIPRVIKAVGASGEADHAEEFLQAMVRLRKSTGSYVIAEGSVRLTEETLFRTDVALPSNLTEGDYRVRIFLTRGGHVVDHLERGIAVRKAGLERFFTRMAHEQPLQYGLLALAFAAGAGWMASAAFRWVR